MTLPMRILAVLSAALLVGAFALATVLPPDMPLAGLLSMWDQGMVARVQATAQQEFPGWVWTQVTLPLLLRPGWLIPASLGVICAGVAATLANSAGPSSHTRRRRS